MNMLKAQFGIVATICASLPTTLDAQTPEDRVSALMRDLRALPTPRSRGANRASDSPGRVPEQFLRLRPHFAPFWSGVFDGSNQLTPSLRYYNAEIARGISSVNPSDPKKVFVSSFRWSLCGFESVPRRWLIYESLTYSNTASVSVWMNCPSSRFGGVQNSNWLNTFFLEKFSGEWKITYGGGAVQTNTEGQRLIDEFGHK